MEEAKKQVAQLTYQVSKLQQQLTDIQIEINEHRIVLDTLKGLKSEKKAFRLLHGVLVEKNVGVVTTEIVDNEKKLSTVEKSLQDTIAQKNGACKQIQREHKLTIKPDGSIVSYEEEKKS